MLPTSELASIRATANTTMDTSCVIKRRTGTHDGYMGETDTWATVATLNINISEPTAGQMQNYDFLIGSLATWQVRLPYSTDIQEHDYIYIGSLVMQVQVVLAPRSHASVVTALATAVE